MVAFTVSAMWLLGMLAAVALVQSAPIARSTVLGAAGVFAAGVPLVLWLSPQPNWVAVLGVSLIIWRLISGPSSLKAGLFSGALAALVGGLQIASGVGAMLAVSLCAAGLLCAFVWDKGLKPKAAKEATSPSQTLRWEWILVAAALLLPPLGLVNEILYGWHSATALSQAPTPPEAAAVTTPGWAVAIVIASLIAGLVRGLWIRR